MPQLAQIFVVLALLGAARLAQGGADRAPLLEDGSFLTRVIGTLEPPSDRRGWSFRLRGNLEGQQDRVLALLPSAVLQEMVRRYASLDPGAMANFEMSARVTTYRGMNAALPLFATPVSGLPPVAARAAMRPPGAVLVEAPEPELPDDAWPSQARAENPMEAFGIRWVPLLPQARESRERALAQRGTVKADDIERDLLDRVGDVQRSADLAPNERDLEQASMLAGTEAGTVDPLSSRPWLDAARSVQDRHGVVTRDPVTGEWRFVFESSRGEIGEREVTLLPCAALERLERQARSTQGPLSVVMSGQVTRYEGRAYLLPTVATPIRTGRMLGR
jgi:hypothetical protein